MSIFNDKLNHGWMSKSLHWTMVVLYVYQFYLAWARDYMSDSDPRKISFIVEHKSYGVIIFAIGAFFILWRMLTPKVPAPKKSAWYERLLAWLTHWGLLLSMVMMPCSGYLQSTFGGYPTHIFGVYTLPMYFIESAEHRQLWHELHETGAWIIVGLVSLHVFAAFYHHFVRKNTVLKSMIPYGGRLMDVDKNAFGKDKRRIKKLGKKKS